MDVLSVTRQLENIRDSDDFVGHVYELIEEWSRDPDGFVAVESVLRFMERHPDVDYGAPGPLVHFVESFYRRGYESELLSSVERRPTTHTVSMLNALINATKEPEEKKRYISALVEAGRSPLANKAVRDGVARYLVRIGNLS